MRGLVVPGVLALAAVLGVGAIAYAGAPTTDGAGNFLMIDVEVSPPRAASTPTLRYHAFFGNRDGAFPPREARNEIELARGFRLNGRAFPKCPLPKEASDVGEERCKDSARVGRGTFEADPRPTLEDRVSGKFVIYNGERRKGRTTLIFLGEAQIGGNAVRSELDFEYVGSTLRSLRPPEGTPEGLFSLTKTDATLSAKHRGRSYVTAPARCRGSWRFRETVFFEGGGSITARDRVPCVARR